MRVCLTGVQHSGEVDSATCLQFTRVPAPCFACADIVWFGASLVGTYFGGNAIGETVYLQNSWTDEYFTATKTDVWGNSSSTTLTMWHEAMLGVLNPATMDSRLDGYYGVGCFWGNQ